MHPNFIYILSSVVASSIPDSLENTAKNINTVSYELNACVAVQGFRFGGDQAGTNKCKPYFRVGVIHPQ